MSISAEIKIVSDSGKTALDQYNEQLRALILTPQGSLVGNRDFGIDYDLLDLPPDQAATYMEMELAEKLPLFIPDIVARKVEFTAGIDGVMQINITIGKADEDEDDDT